MKDKIKIGVVGLGGRGYGLLKYVMLTMDDVEVVAVCDLYEDRTERGAQAVEEFRGNVPFKTQNYKDILAMPEVDAVVCTTSWRDHFRIVIDTMKAGKDAASEVGGAYSLEECWELVRTYEETGVPCMMMENCCFGRDEMMVLNMVKQGIFGVFEVFMDTVVVCTMTALVVLLGVGVDNVVYGVDIGADLTIQGFMSVFPGKASALAVAICLSLFALSTVLTWALYGTRCVEFLLGYKASKVYQVIFCLFACIAGTVSLDLAWGIADTLNGLMAIPNLIAVALLSPQVVKLTKEYFTGVKAKK